VLAKQGLHIPVTDVFGPAGRVELAAAPLDRAYRARVNAYLRLVDALDVESELAARWIAARLAVRWQPHRERVHGLAMSSRSRLVDDPVGRPRQRYGSVIAPTPVPWRSSPVPPVSSVPLSPWRRRPPTTFPALRAADIT
jgi:hypothetical protein